MPNFRSSASGADFSAKKALEVVNLLDFKSRKVEEQEEEEDDDDDHDNGEGKGDLDYFYVIFILFMWWLFK